MKIIVEIEYQSGLARDIAVDDVRRALSAFMPHKIISVKEVAQQNAQRTCETCGAIDMFSDNVCVECGASR